MSKNFKRVFALLALAKVLRLLVSSFVGACQIKKTQRLDVIACHLLDATKYIGRGLAVTKFV
jgi:hypothetical protein